MNPPDNFGAWWSLCPFSFRPSSPHPTPPHAFSDQLLLKQGNHKHPWGKIIQRSSSANFTGKGDEQVRRLTPAFQSRPTWKRSLIPNAWKANQDTRPSNAVYHARKDNRPSNAVCPPPTQAFWCTPYTEEFGNALSINAETIWRQHLQDILPAHEKNQFRTSNNIS